MGLTVVVGAACARGRAMLFIQFGRVNIPIIHIPTAYRAIFIPRNAPVRERSPEPGVLIRSLRKVQLDLDGCLNPLHIFVRDHARAAEEAGFADDRQLLQHGLARHDLGPCAHG